MRFSRWQAQGNVYLVADEPLSSEGVRAAVGDADGVLEVKDRGRDWIELLVVCALSAAVYPPLVKGMNDAQLTFGIGIGISQED